MADKNYGYIFLNKNMKQWRWVKNPNTAWTFVYLLLSANYQDHDFQNVTIHRGQVATSIASLAFNTGQSYAQARRSLSNMVSTGELTITRHSKFLVITIVKYDEYQNADNQKTNIRQTDDNQMTNKSQHLYKYNKRNTENKKNKGSLRSDLPEQIEDIIPERDLAGFPSFEDMPCIADGTKRDIPPRVRHLFGSQYDAYWRYMEKCSMS